MSWRRDRTDPYAAGPGDPTDLAELLAQLVADEAESYGWPRLHVRALEEVWMEGRPGVAAFVVVDEAHGRQWVVGVKERGT